eukprot:XP_014778350.1 PREDICTED: uncharacterized protein LOC106874944 isoform X2 [Octopus bimaculoides]
MLGCWCTRRWSKSPFRTMKHLLQVGRKKQLGNPDLSDLINQFWRFFAGSVDGNSFFQGTRQFTHFLLPEMYQSLWMYKKISASTNTLTQGETPELMATSILISGKQISANRFLK